MSDLDPLLRDIVDAQRAYLSCTSVPGRVKARLAAMPVNGRRPTALAEWLWRPRLLGSLAGGVAVAAALVVVWSLRAPPLSFTVVGQPGHAGEVIGGDTAGAAAVPVVFSDGTTLAVEARSQIQVVDVDARGATLALARGRAEVHVRHRDGARWRFRSGPFEVNVTGTRFLLGWDPAARSMSLHMHEGSVEVRAEGRPGFIAVRGGQQLFMRDGGVEWKLEPERMAGDQPAVPTVAAPPAAEPPVVDVDVDVDVGGGGRGATARRAPAARGGGGAGGGGRARWRSLAVAGRYQQALAVVSRQGFDETCQRLGPEDLILLGDAARLAQDGRRAEKAYKVARRRFPRLDRPAFTLGLVAFEQRRDFAAAARWFETYLAEHPRGALADEAAGRVLESWHRAGRRAETRRAATAYLRRAPSGPYADLARHAD